MIIKTNYLFKSFEVILPLFFDAGGGEGREMYEGCVFLFCKEIRNEEELVVRR